MDHILLARKKRHLQKQKKPPKKQKNNGREEKMRKRRQECAEKGLTDTFWAAVTPFGVANVSHMAGDLAGSFQLITLVTGETHQCSNSKPRFRAYGTCSVHHLSRIGTLLDCEDQCK